MSRKIIAGKIPGGLRLPPNVLFGSSLSSREHPIKDMPSRSEGWHSLGRCPRNRFAVPVGLGFQRGTGGCRMKKSGDPMIIYKCVSFGAEMEANLKSTGGKGKCPVCPAINVVPGHANG